ncbi:hypothetical protein PO909_014458 [Leuciscus waleckii]
MSTQVVQERHLWLKLAEMKEVDKVHFLNSPISQARTAGTSIVPLVPLALCLEAWLLLTSPSRWNQLVQTQTDVHQMIQDRKKKIQEIKHSVELRKRNTEEERSTSVENFTDLIRSIRRCHSDLLKMMEEQQKAAEKQAEGLIIDLHQEITELKRRNTELEQLSHTDDHLHLIQVHPIDPTTVSNGVAEVTVLALGQTMSALVVQKRLKTSPLGVCFPPAKGRGNNPERSDPEYVMSALRECVSSPLLLLEEGRVENFIYVPPLVIQSAVPQV